MTEPSDCADIIKSEVYKLEALTLGKSSYEGYFGGSFNSRVGQGTAKHDKDWARDYIVITPHGDYLSVVMDTSKMTAFQGMFRDIKAPFLRAKQALQDAGVDHVTLGMLLVPVDGRDQVKPKLVFTVPNNIEGVKLLGKANQDLLLQRAKDAYGAGGNLYAAQAEITAYASGHTAKKTLEAFDRFHKEQEGLALQR